MNGVHLELSTLRPLSHLPRAEINGAADFDAGQNYTRPPRSPNSPWPWPTMIGYIQGLLPQMTLFVVDNQQNRLPESFYLGGSALAVQGGMSFGNAGINGLTKIRG